MVIPPWLGYWALLAENEVHHKTLTLLLMWERYHTSHPIQKHIVLGDVVKLELVFHNPRFKPVWTNSDTGVLPRLHTYVTPVCQVQHNCPLHQVLLIVVLLLVFFLTFFFRVVSYCVRLYNHFSPHKEALSSGWRSQVGTVFPQSVWIPNQFEPVLRLERSHTYTRK
jgi:hypothetical protein